MLWFSLREFFCCRAASWVGKTAADESSACRTSPTTGQCYALSSGREKDIFGLTRVVWELEEVKAGEGGTTFLSGSHKAHFNYGGNDPNTPNIGGSPWEQNINAAMEDYSCPAGSVVIFTESLLHAANDWTNPSNPRCAVFNCYNSLWAQVHRLNIDNETISKMPPKRRTLFRGLWQLGDNTVYSEDNRSL